MNHIEIYTVFDSEAEAKAAELVLQARGANPSREGSRLVCLPGHRQFGGLGPLTAFIRWAKDAQLEVSVRRDLTAVDESTVLSQQQIDDLLRPYGHARDPFCGALVCLAEHADSLREVRQVLVDTYDHCGYGGVNLRSDTLAVAGGVRHGFQELATRLERAEKEADDNRLEAASQSAAVDQLSAELRELRSVLSSNWLSAKVRKKLGIEKQTSRY